MRTMTKSALDLAKTALRVGTRSLDTYSSKYSRKDFTQAQLFALLTLRDFFKADYRKTTQIVEEWSDLREALQLLKVPHWTTLEKAGKRMLKKGDSTGSSMANSTWRETAA